MQHWTPIHIQKGLVLKVVSISDNMKAISPLMIIAGIAMGIS